MRKFTGVRYRIIVFFQVNGSLRVCSRHFHIRCFEFSISLIHFAHMVGNWHIPNVGDRVNIVCPVMMIIIMLTSTRKNHSVHRTVLFLMRFFGYFQRSS